MGKLTVTFLGSGDAFGSGGRLQACIHVAGGSVPLLLDCGASALCAMKRLGVNPSAIDAILVTHLHGDHFGGIPFFLLEGHLVSKRDRPLSILGPPGTQERVTEAMKVFFPGSSEMKLGFPLEYREWADHFPVEVGEWTVTPYQVVHGSGAPPFALRLECPGKVIAYSGDTEWCDALVDAARNADLFICEAFTYEKKMKYHLDYRTLLDHRAELGCRRLVATHMSEDMISRLSLLEAEWADDGKRILL